MTTNTPRINPQAALDKVAEAIDTGRDYVQAESDTLSLFRIADALERLADAAERIAPPRGIDRFAPPRGVDRFTPKAR